MPVYGQGDFYEEEEIEEEDTAEETPKPKSQSRKPTRQEIPEEEEDTEEPEPKKKAKPNIQLNPKVIACVVGLVVVLIIVLFVVVGISSSQKKKAEAKAEQEVLAQIQAMEDYYNEHPEERPTPADPSATVAPEVNEVTPSAGVLVSYKLDDIKVLRKWGYTANELEVASRDGISAKALVEQAKKDREAAQREALKVVSDTASPEYQNLLNMTWLGGEPLDLTGVDPNIVYNTETWTENVDYEKCGAQGTQLFIKLYLDDGTAAFMAVTPGRYVELADSGNIVVNLEALTSETLRVITKVTEVRVN